MESNLARPYGDKPSPPHDSRLAFWSSQSEDLLFDQASDEIVIHCRAGLRSVALDWTLNRNQFKTSFAEGQAEAIAGNRFIIRIPTKLLTPGFYDLRVRLDSGLGDPVPGICSFGFAVGSMPITDTRPNDFMEFWSKGLAALQSVSLNAELGEMETFNSAAINQYNLDHAAIPADYDPQGHRVEVVESCKVSFDGIGDKRIHGWLAKPEGEGPFPAMLVLPGAGFNARPRPLEHARHGYLAMDIQVHGQEVDLEEYPRLPGYYDGQVYEPVEDFYYYDVYLNVVQAINYLLSRPDVDPDRIVVVGGSQGGRLSIVAAALDPRVAAAVPAIPHSGDVAYLKWFKSANDLNEPFAGARDGMDRAAPPAMPATAEGRCLPYFDPVNFAPEITCPVLMNGGLVDPVSYVSGVWAIYEKLGSENKAMVPLPGLGHDWSPEFDRMAWRWLDRVLD
ncbi:acetylxylan esterase [Coraliomargarita algicola]|uniref:Acetylxylan esterase n=1 Tax=Coraliomargarita algicola TaxID=3092156 RepID=A0ABZ0RNK3_9BACT|nr:acetylxylan esterase [Coraliomargarita sp. J2-16]WPJ96711.1 acetylxylan esterase [Coraliomargarita sp. J2-16]